MRRVQWVGREVAFQSFGSTAAFEVVTEAEMEVFTSPTIIRIVGTLIFKLNTSTNNLYEATKYRFGLIVAHKSIGTAEIVGSDYTNAWLYTDSGLLWASTDEQQVYNGTTNITYSTQNTGYRKQVHNFDARAMRKVGRNERLILVLERENAAGSPSNPEMFGHIRVLVKE